MKRFLSRRPFVRPENGPAVSTGRFISAAREKKKKVTACGRITFSIEDISIISFFYTEREGENRLLFHFQDDNAV